MRNKKLIFMLLLIFGLAESHAQETTLPTGKDISGSGGSVSYSVGQINYNIFDGITGSVSEGVQQPFEISVVSGIEKAEEINLIISAYPNPVLDILTLSIENYDKENLSYQLIDMNGKVLEIKKIDGDNTTIDLNNRAASYYFLKITDNKKEIKLFRIIKN